MLFLIFREKKLKIQLFRLKQISSLNQWRLLWWQWFFIRRKWCWASTSKHTTQFPFHSTKNKKLENGEDIEQGSSLAVVLNQSKKNWSYKNLFFSWNVKYRIYRPRCETVILFSIRLHIKTATFRPLWREISSTCISFSVWSHKGLFPSIDIYSFTRNFGAHHFICTCVLGRKNVYRFQLTNKEALSVLCSVQKARRKRL